MIKTIPENIAHLLHKFRKTITITNSAWNKFDDILIGCGTKDNNIAIFTKTNQNCKCLKGKSSSIIVQPNISLIDQDHVKMIDNLNRKYPPVILHNNNINVILTNRDARLLDGVTIDYKYADYSKRIFNGSFQFTSLNHTSCPCGKLINNE